AYNDIDGVPCCANGELFTTYLRQDQHFDGMVMADGQAVDRLQAMTGSLAGAARAAMLAGVDLSLSDESYTLMGELAEADPQVHSALDQACARVLTLKEKLGLLPPPSDASSAANQENASSAAIQENASSAAIQEKASGPRNTAAGDATTHSWPGTGTFNQAREHGQAASSRLAQESLVLLTNANQRPSGTRAGATLPLEPQALRELAVVGPFAQDVPALLGDYVPPLRENSAPSIAASLQKALPATRVSASEEPQPQELTRADAVVAVVGGTSHRSYDDSFAANGAIQGRSGAATCGEGVDLADLTLPAQEAMIRRLREL